MIDTHCHIFASEFDIDRKAAIERAVDVGVTKIIMPNIDVESIEPLKQVYQQFPSTCYAMMGLHPCSVNEHHEHLLGQIENELENGHFVGIGEIGLDYYWDSTFLNEQKKVFRRQLQLAKEMNLPVAIHTRNSFEDALQIVSEEQDGRLRGVFHCFTGTVENAKQIIDVGLLMGIGGVATFKNGGLDKVLPHINLNYLLLETDSPYLSPVPFRGKRNEPSYIPIIAERIGVIKEIMKEEIIIQTTNNAKNLFLIND